MQQDALFEGSSGDSVSTDRSVVGGLGHSLNDLFSHFTKHIAPTYHHERPERSVQMRLYTMQKGQFVLSFIMFVCLFFIALLMGMAGPKITTEHSESGDNILQRGGSVETGPYVIATPPLDAHRRQLWLSVEIVFKDKNDEAAATLSTPFNLSAAVTGVSADKKRTLLGAKVHRRRRRLNCSGKTCDPFIGLHLGSLQHPYYIFNISLEGLANVQKRYQIERVGFKMTTYNPEFTRMELWFRFFFLLSSLVVFMAFIFSMKDYPLGDWSIEQKWTLLLLPMLSCFNNPLFPLTVLSSGMVSDVLMQSTFLFTLLLYWLCVCHGLRQTERRFITFYLPKILLVGSMWIAATTVAYSEKGDELIDPSFTFQVENAHHKTFQLLFVSLLGCYVTYLLFLCLRAFGELRSMNFIDARLKFHCASLFLTLLLALAITTERYGRGLLEDNLIARIYTSYQSEYHFLAFYTVMNCYILALAYMYTPTRAQKREKHLLKDNPSFSMINESDDEDETDIMLTEEMKRRTQHPTDVAETNQSRLPLLGHDDDSD